MAQILKLSPRHDAIMQWLMANPDKALGECALAFRVSQPWLSTVIHSDVFQARYKELLQGQYDERILPLREKLIGLSHATLDRLAERVTVENDPKVLTDIARMSTRAIGLGVGGTTVNLKGDSAQINIVSAVDVEDIRAARERYIEHCRSRGLPIPEEKASLEGEVVHVAPTEA